MQTLCLLGGMGLGAGLMYLLDPHQGEGVGTASVGMWKTMGGRRVPL